jgi:hypothetical protein
MYALENHERQPDQVIISNVGQPLLYLGILGKASHSTGPQKENRSLFAFSAPKKPSAHKRHLTVSRPLTHLDSVSASSIIDA